MLRTWSAHLHRADLQVAACQHFDIGTSAGAQQDQVVYSEPSLAGPAARLAGLHVEVEDGAVGHRALGGQLEAEPHGVGYDGAQLADLEFHTVHATARGM